MRRCRSSPHRESGKRATAKTPGRTPSANTFKFCNKFRGKANVTRTVRYVGLPRLCENVRARGSRRIVFFIGFARRCSPACLFFQLKKLRRTFSSLLNFGVFTQPRPRADLVGLASTDRPSDYEAILFLITPTTAATIAPATPPPTAWLASAAMSTLLPAPASIGTSALRSWPPPTPPTAPAT